jgi:biotin transport system substrate-specific component
MFGDLKRSRIITYTAVFIGLITLGSWISIPFLPVPFTLQTLFVLLAGAVMKRSAVIPVGLYIVMGAAGLPVFHNGAAGIGVLLGPTGGYLIGFASAALITGIVYEFPQELIRITGLILATAATYVCGVAWLVYSTGLGIGPAVAAGVLPFIAGDCVKAGAAALIARRLS